MTPQEVNTLANQAPQNFGNWVYALFLLGGIPAITGVASVLVPWLNKKKDSNTDSQRIQMEERKALSLDRQAVMDFIKGDNKDLRDQIIAKNARIAELENEIERLKKDRDRGWGIARAWFEKAMRFLHDWNNLVLAFSVLNPDKPYRRPPNKVPRFEDIDETSPEEFNEDQPFLSQSSNAAKVQ